MDKVENNCKYCTHKTIEIKRFVKDGQKYADIGEFEEDRRKMTEIAFKKLLPNKEFTEETYKQLVTSVDIETECSARANIFFEDILICEVIYHRFYVLKVGSEGIYEAKEYLRYVIRVHNRDWAELSFFYAPKSVIIEWDGADEGEKNE